MTDGATTAVANFRRAAHASACARPGGRVARPSGLPGFTLVELLVVIGIVGLSIAVLLPTLSGARQQAASAACLSNQRQMAVAAGAYTSAYRGRYPSAYWSDANAVETISINWDFTIRTDRVTRQKTLEPGLIWMGERAMRVQQCPAYDGPSNTAADPFTGYNYNTSVVGRGQYEDVAAPAKVSDLVAASETALFGDGQYAGGANKFMRSPFPTPYDGSFASRAAGTQGWRHRGRTNAAYADGHAQSLAERYTSTTPGEQPRLTDNTGFLGADNSAYGIRR